MNLFKYYAIVHSSVYVVKTISKYYWSILIILYYILLQLWLLLTFAYYVCPAADLMPSFIRHGPTIPRRTEVSLPELGPSAYPVATNREPVVSPNKSFLRTPVQRPPHEVARRESHRMSAPPYLPRSLGDLPHEYGGSSQSFLTDVSPMSENGDAARFYYPSEPYYDNQQRQQHQQQQQQQQQRQPRRVPNRFPEDYRYYEHSEHNFQRLNRQHTPPAPSRPPSGNEICLSHYGIFIHCSRGQRQKIGSKNSSEFPQCLQLHIWSAQMVLWFWKEYRTTFLFFFCNKFCGMKVFLSLKT